jgi:epoxide hydrolase-like predicted phosphatase
VAIRAVMVDFGSVLVRLEDASRRRALEARLGLAENELAEIVFGSEAAARAAEGKISESAVWEPVVARFGLDAEGLREFQRDFWAGNQLDERLAEFVRGLRPHYRTAILSNAWSDARRVFTEIYGLDGAVDEIIISAEEGVAKPDPRIYHIAAERLGVRPEESVFVDDMARNVEAARAVGMRAVHFRDTDQAIAEVRRIIDAEGGPGPGG